MIFQKLSFFVIIILFGTTCLSAQKVSIVGKALNAKAGAVVVTESGMHYYVDRLAYWEKFYYDKKVKVSGVVVTDTSFVGGRDFNEKSQEDIRQEIKGPIKIIKKAKWILVK